MIRKLLMSAVVALLPLSAAAAPDEFMGVGIHPDDFYVFDLNGRLLFVDDREILKLIGTFEGPDGYDTVYYGSRIKPEKPITEMTIEEVQNWQNRSVSAGSKSSAAGVFQFIRNSLRDTADKAGIPRSTKFDRFTQDRMARHALRRCGFYRHDVADKVIGDCLAGTWAALPVMTGPRAGKSRYQGVAGNKSLTSIEHVLSTIQGRFRDIVYAGELRNYRPHPVEHIQPGQQTATLVQERSDATGEIVFAVSAPDPEQLKADREARFRASLDARAKRLTPFGGYVRAEARAEEVRSVPRSIPVFKKTQ